VGNSGAIIIIIIRADRRIFSLFIRAKNKIRLAKLARYEATGLEHRKSVIEYVSLFNTAARSGAGKDGQFLFVGLYAPVFVVKRKAKRSRGRFSPNDRNGVLTPRNRVIGI